MDAEPLHRALGLTDDELESITKILGREPNRLELSMYSVMWSEHCSYKSSKVHLRRLPTEAPWVICGPGENAGVIDGGDGVAIALRIESHNHPSAVEPYQGAATGVGGILRDIFTMGARPSPCSTRCASARLTSRATGGSVKAWSRACRVTATRWVCRRWAASSSSTRPTRRTRSST